MPREQKEKKERSEVVHDIGDVTDSVLADVIELARLDSSAPGMAVQKGHLKAILEHFKVLNQVHPEGLDPTIQIHPTPIPLRPDEVGESLTVEQALANARYRAGGVFFLAPIILGGEKADEG
jgi:aspartyl/glutamyl-tRNA(Asn/Gln) amidotransferase C subunit